MGIGHLLELVYCLKAGLRISGVFSNSALDLLEKGGINLFDMLTKLDDLFRSRNEFIFVYLYHEIVLTFYGFILGLDVMDLLAIGFIN